MKHVKFSASRANLTIRDAEDKVKLSGSDIKQGSAKQEFKQETNQPTVTFKVKDKNKFKKVTEEISKKRDNVMVVWLDFKKGDSYKKEAQKKKVQFIFSTSGIKQQFVIIKIVVFKGQAWRRQWQCWRMQVYLPVDLKKFIQTQ